MNLCPSPHLTSDNGAPSLHPRMSSGSQHAVGARIARDLASAASGLQLRSFCLSRLEGPQLAFLNHIQVVLMQVALGSHP